MNKEFIKVTVGVKDERTQHYSEKKLLIPLCNIAYIVPDSNGSNRCSIELKPNVITTGKYSSYTATIPDETLKLLVLNY